MPRMRNINLETTIAGSAIIIIIIIPARAKRAWDRAPYSWNMVNLFSSGCHVTDVRTDASTDCTGRVGETIKRKGGVSQACLGQSSSFIYDTHLMRKRVSKSEAILALPDTFEELHLEW